MNIRLQKLTTFCLNTSVQIRKTLSVASRNKTAVVVASVALLALYSLPSKAGGIGSEESSFSWFEANEPAIYKDKKPYRILDDGSVNHRKLPDDMYNADGSLDSEKSIKYVKEFRQSDEYSKGLKEIQERKESERADREKARQERSEEMRQKWCIPTTRKPCN